MDIVQHNYYIYAIRKIMEYYTGMSHHYCHFIKHPIIAARGAIINYLSPEELANNFYFNKKHTLPAVY